VNRLFGTKVFKSFTNLAIIQLFTYLSPLIVIPHLYKVIGVEKYGLFAFTNSFVFYFILIVDFGFQLYATKEVAANKEDKHYINKLFTAIYISKLCLLILAAVCYFILIGFIPFFSKDNIIYQFAFLQVLGFFFLPIWLFQGYENIRPLTIINAISRLLFLFATILLIRHVENYKWVQLINSLSILIYGLASFFVAKRIFNLSFVNVDKAMVNNVILKSSWYFGSRIATSLYTVSNTILLGFGSSNYDVGVYSVAERFYFAIQNLLQPVTSAIYPYISSTRDIRPIKKYLTPAILIFSLGCIIVVFFADDIFIRFIKNIDPKSITVFKVLCVVLIVTFPSIVLGYPVTAAMGHDKMANVPVFYAAAFHILVLGIFYFCGFLSPVNVAILLLFTELGLLTMRFIIVRHLGIFRHERKS